MLQSIHKLDHRIRYYPFNPCQRMWEMLNPWHTKEHKSCKTTLSFVILEDL